MAVCLCGLYSSHLSVGVFFGLRLKKRRQNWRIPIVTANRSTFWPPPVASVVRFGTKTPSPRRWKGERGFLYPEPSSSQTANPLKERWRGGLSPSPLTPAEPISKERTGTELPHATARELPLVVVTIRVNNFLASTVRHSVNYWQHYWPCFSFYIQN